MGRRLGARLLSSSFGSTGDRRSRVAHKTGTILCRPPAPDRRQRDQRSRQRESDPLARRSGAPARAGGVCLTISTDLTTVEPPCRPRRPDGPAENIQASSKRLSRNGCRRAASPRATDTTRRKLPAVSECCSPRRAPTLSRRTRARQPVATSRTATRRGSPVVSVQPRRPDLQNCRVQPRRGTPGDGKRHCRCYGTGRARRHGPSRPLPGPA